MDFAGSETTQDRNCYVQQSRMFKQRSVHALVILVALQDYSKNSEAIGGWGNIGIQPEIDRDL
jgi:hypothetical protein